MGKWDWIRTIFFLKKVLQMVAVVGKSRAHRMDYGALAQLVERLHGMQKVSGSIPLCSTILPTRE